MRRVGKASKAESYIFQKFLKNIVLSSSEKKESDRVQRIVGHEKFMISCICEKLLGFVRTLLLKDNFEKNVGVNEESYCSSTLQAEIIC